MNEIYPSVIGIIEFFENVPVEDKKENYRFPGPECIKKACVILKPKVAPHPEYAIFHTESTP